MMPSEVEQKLLFPVPAPMGVATATKSLHIPKAQLALMVKRYPDDVHQFPEVQVLFANFASSRSAWSAERFAVLVGSGPKEARSGAKPRSGYVEE